MKTILLKKTRKLWNNDLVSPSLNKSNQLKWARAVHSLGDRWLLASFISKVDQKQDHCIPASV